MPPSTKEQSRHEAHLYRLLAEILDNKYLANHAFFKGGTCARMLGYLDRFSVDLDFDLVEEVDKVRARELLHEIFDNLGLELKDESKEALQFFLRYDAPANERNTIKLELLDKVFVANEYTPQYLAPVERTAQCQTIETMFGNKLVAPMDRFEKGRGVAGRDIYDIHYFFMQGHEYNKAIIEERRDVSVREYLQTLIDFVEARVTRRVLEEDLNPLLDTNVLQRVRKHLKREVLQFLKSEVERLASV